MKAANKFSSSDQHSDATPQDLSDKWGVSLIIDSKTLQNTTHKRFLLSTILSLSRRYRTDRVLNSKTLLGEWLTNMMDDRGISLEGNKCAQVF